jgi:hypothetical protein
MAAHPVPFLRLSRKHITAYDERVDEVRARLATLRSTARRQRATLSGRLGALLTADPERLTEARALLETSLAMASSMGAVRLVVANGVRYATLLQYSGAHDAAIAHFDATLALIDARGVRRYKRLRAATPRKVPRRSRGVRPGRGVLPPRSTLTTAPTRQRPRGVDGGRRHGADEEAGGIGAAVGASPGTAARIGRPNG